VCSRYSYQISNTARILVKSCSYWRPNTNLAVLMIMGTDRKSSLVESREIRLAKCGPKNKAPHVHP
jgi:hypothetical protein